jgi:hypothetical protein
VPECEWRGTIFANGNNINLVGDMTRRAIICNLDPQMERPELRKFKHNPTANIMAKRGAYVAAILTIARSYLASGSRVECESIASYGGWARVVREPLIWLGEADPIRSQDQARDMDPERGQARELIAHWKDVLGTDKHYTAREIVDVATSVKITRGEGESPKPSLPEFCDLLLTRCGRSGVVDANRLARWLGKIRGQVHLGHYRVELVQETQGHGNRYCLRNLKEPKTQCTAAELVEVPPRPTSF